MSDARGYDSTDYDERDGVKYVDLCVFLEQNSSLVLTFHRSRGTYAGNTPKCLRNARPGQSAVPRGLCRLLGGALHRESVKPALDFSSTPTFLVRGFKRKLCFFASTDQLSPVNVLIHKTLKLFFDVLTFL